MKRKYTVVKKERSCDKCGKKGTSGIGGNKGSNFSRKRGYVNKWLCHNCYIKLYSNPRRMYFRPLDKRIYLNKCPRKGKCNECKNTVKSGQIEFTQIHHKKYHKKNPLRDTIELCLACHGAKHDYNFDQLMNKN